MFFSKNPCFPPSAACSWMKGENVPRWFYTYELNMYKKNKTNKSYLFWFRSIIFFSFFLSFFFYFRLCLFISSSTYICSFLNKFYQPRSHAFFLGFWVWAKSRARSPGMRLKFYVFFISIKPWILSLKIVCWFKF